MTILYLWYSIQCTWSLQQFSMKSVLVYCCSHPHCLLNASPIFPTFNFSSCVVVRTIPQSVGSQAKGCEWNDTVHPTHPPTREKRETHANLSPGILGTLAFWYKSADMPTYDTKFVKHTCNVIEVEKNKKLEKWQLEVNKSSEEGEEERKREEKAANNKKPRALNYSHGGKQEWVICSTIGSKVVTTNIRN